MNRRSFLRTATAAGAISAVNLRILGAEDKAGRKQRTVLIGCGWWGNNILREAMASGACSIVGLCDVDARHSSRPSPM